jgi:2-polyprenyl-3-methyl-5-hydroxy-6-metoxy-1,4-benzoquinol methylase
LPEVTQKDVTDKVKSFYENNPFPNYDDFDDVSSLIHQAKEGIFARILDEQIPFGARILEVGCGTGQLSIFLSIANRSVFATDMSFNSLRLGEEFKEKNKLERVHFLQMNLFRPIFKPESFDLVICNGVLHHTSDPFGGFKKICSLIKPNGYILIGLYHKYGRIITDLGRFIHNIFGFKSLPFKKREIQAAKRNIWLLDQYRNPHESRHAIREVLGWFRQAGFQFIKSLPKTRLFENFSEKGNLFKPDLLGSKPQLFGAEIGMIFSGNKNGGFFIMIGQKKY